MRARLASGALGLRMAAVRADATCMIYRPLQELTDPQVEFNSLATSGQWGSLSTPVMNSGEYRTPAEA
jgi:hypothetical protein